VTEEEKTEILLQILYDIGDLKKIIKEKDPEQDSQQIITLQAQIIDLLHRYICVYSIQIKEK
tara:strand:+ start:1019 stop:1204 length:186 start_codon:yes stop_codon:yes gene_type:complete